MTINIMHLLWIIPLSGAIGAFSLAIFVQRSDKK